MKLGSCFELHRKGNCAELNILVVREKPLGYNLLIGIDAIWALGGIEVMTTRDVQLVRKCKSCEAIMIEELDFCATFNHKEKAWTARWKWTRNKAPNQLHNTIMEYTVSDKNIFSKGWCWLCVRDELEMGTDCHIDPMFFWP